MIFKMSGPGIGHVILIDGQVEAIQLEGTTSKTRIKIVAKGKDTLDVVRLFTGDDDSLRQLIIDGVITTELIIGGNVGRLKLGGVGPGSVIMVGGDVLKADLGTLSGEPGSSSEITFIQNVKPLQTNSVGEGVRI
ncbi:hypothetical protein IIB79_00920, partial [candidate division KSB1 bacterium]|nr:hypothetical protein [candidate division KSB1 bacterium]